MKFLIFEYITETKIRSVEVNAKSKREAIKLFNEIKDTVEQKVTGYESVDVTRWY